MNAALLTSETARMLRAIAAAFPPETRTDRALAKKIETAALTLAVTAVVVDHPDVRNVGADSPMCWECGDRASEKAHLIPRLRGGRSTVPLCGPCHGRMHGMSRSQDISQLTREGLARARARGVVLGRPRTIPPERIDAALALVAAGWTVTAAAAHVGVSRATLYEHLSRRHS